MENKKKILITGGSRGIGKELVNFFSNKNFIVYYTYYKTKPSYTIKKNIKPMKCNLENLNDVKKLILNLKKKKIKLNFLINNAGNVFKRSSFKKSTQQLWQKTLNLNLISPIILTNGLMPIFEKKKSVIINISSISSRIGGGGDSMHYGVAKAAINAFTIGLAKELNNIRVVAIAPSIIDTDFQKKHSSKKRLKKIIKETPVGRIGNVEDIRNLVEFLISEKSSYISGEVIYLSGGR